MKPVFLRVCTMNPNDACGVYFEVCSSASLLLFLKKCSAQNCKKQYIPLCALSSNFSGKQGRWVEQKEEIICIYAYLEISALWDTILHLRDKICHIVGLDLCEH